LQASSSTSAIARASGSILLSIPFVPGTVCLDLLCCFFDDALAAVRLLRVSGGVPKANQKLVILILINHSEAKKH
jgi:hypothetical protein